MAPAGSDGTIQEGKSPFEAYDSRADTCAHIARVQELMRVCVAELKQRLQVHDASKLEPFEKSFFDEFTPKLKGLTYGSDEYKAMLAAMKPGLDHHYANNRHHPEFHADGIRGMTLLDLLEMFCDWKAATERHADGDLATSIDFNQRRFRYSDDLRAIFINTALAYGWIEPPKPAFAIQVNGADHVIECPEISYEKIAELAGLDPERIYSCVYSVGPVNARAGSVVKGELVRVESGMRFTMMDTSNA